MRLKVATFNVRNTNDRYDERRPLLAAAFAAIDADLIGLQEVVFGDEQQDTFLAAQLPDRHYRSLTAHHERFPNFGNATLAGVGETLAHEQLQLSHRRVVHRALVALPGARTVWFVNTHLHHKPEEPEVREEQAQVICAWLAEAPEATATIVVGDFNAPPFEPAYRVMTEAGFRSAYAEVCGVEPAFTWPSGIQAPTMDTEGDPNCLDYIWLRGRVAAVAARLGANEPQPGDPTLYPSDHFSIVAELDL